MKKIILSLALVACGFNSFAQKEKQPKLVVGIVVDQMRYDYLSRFWDEFSEGGFKKMINQGFSSRNTHYNYVPTYTGPGHASIYTGTSPRYHGIIANNWYDKNAKEMRYCVWDENAKSIGVKNSPAGQMSPKNMMAHTFADELKIYTQFQAKTYAVSIKDRGSILPLGHIGNAAFWFDGKNESMITSNFYLDKSPKWLDKFNNKRLPKKYLSKNWEPLRAYQELYTKDNNLYEKPFETETKPTFPHKLPEIYKAKGGKTLSSTPFGNTYLVDFSIDLIENNEIGKDQTPDFLSISFSSPDKIGHQFGTQSWEIKDTYLRLDKDLERLINYLEKEIGKDHFVMFLTADHGGAYNAQFLKDNQSPANYFETERLEEKLNNHCQKQFGTGNIIENISNQQIFLNKEILAKNDLERDDIEEFLMEKLLEYKGIHQVFLRSTLEQGLSQEYTGKLIQKGFQPARSGDLAYTLNPNWMDYMHHGTTHGSSYTYDTHVPLIWYGWEIKKGQSYRRASITDIISTVSSFFHIASPNGGTGKILDVRK
ncbi:MAG: alkaline phosphatase family protein [Flavobacteriales bacterium]|jgi:predicted AlkP superfamily pyrophosphatase or phosphodiesterase|nr:alkaline phosphatase family protein [Flavobacteriales bacterium]